MTQELAVLYARSLQQVDAYHFDIQWSDNSCKRYRLSDLQQACPCASCSGDGSDQGQVKLPETDPNLLAKSISNVGRYALQIHFSKGCSNGIFTFTMLHELGELVNEV